MIMKELFWHIVFGHFIEWCPQTLQLKEKTEMKVKMGYNNGFAFL